MSNRDVYITQFASFLPGAPVSNDEMESLLGMVGDKPSRSRKIVLKSNGITSRHYALDPETLQPSHTNAELTANAIRALETEAFSVSDIQCIATGTSSPDQLAPNHAVMVHGELGIPSCECMSASGICLSGMSAMKYAYMAVTAGFYEAAVATGSEISSLALRSANFSVEHESKVAAMVSRPEIAFEKDFLRWMLSDGAGAALLQTAPVKHQINLKVEWIEMFSYANEMEACMYAGANKVDGKLAGWHTYSVEERAAQSVMSLKQDVKLLDANVVHYTAEKPLAEVVEKHQLDIESIDWFVPHYSSNYFREKLYQGLESCGFEIPYEKWFTNLTEKGNTGSASIYILLEGLLSSQDVKNGDKILCYIPESGRFSSCYMLLTAVYA